MARLTKPVSGWPLQQVASGLGVSLTPEAEARLSIWLDTMAVWNARMDLTAARSCEELLDLMVADAMVLSQHVAPNAVVVDVGTGAGAPGFALACMRPDLKLHLVDPLAKRISFLRIAGAEAGLKNVTLHLGNLEQVAHTLPACTEATARATFAPEVWLARATAELPGVQRIWLFLARDGVPAQASVTQTIAYAWPLTGADRTLVAAKP